MRYKAFACMNIAVIGDGGIVESLVRELAKGSYNISIGNNSPYPVFSNMLLNDFSNIQLTKIEDAAAQADVIILATPSEKIKEAAYFLDDVRDKVIIDMSGFFFTRFGQYFNTS